MKLYLAEHPPLSSQALQHHILAHHLNTHPDAIHIDRSKKPVCTSHSVEFSVSHTRHAFAMAIHYESVGIDMEAFDRSIPWAIFNRHRTPAIDAFNAPWPPAKLSKNHQKVWHWTRWEAHCKLTGTGLLFPILPQPSSHVQSFFWQDLCLSVASQGPVDAPECLRLTVGQNVDSGSDKRLKWSVDTDAISPLH